jgi:hypothetical protein
MVNMNMIVNSSDLVGYEAETKIETKEVASKAQTLSNLLKVWERKQFSASKKAAGLGFLAVSLAACNSDDSTPFSQADVTAAEAVATTAATTAALNPYTTLADAIASNDAAITTAATTAALTAADGTVYTTVDAAKTAGINTSSADAIAAARTTALTSADGTVHATIDAAITSNDAAVTTAATAAAETTLTAGTGFTTVADLAAAYTTATAASTASYTLVATADAYTGGTGADTITGTSATLGATDIIVGGEGIDSITINATGAVTAPALITGVENVTMNLTSFAAATLDVDNVKEYTTMTFNNLQTSGTTALTVNNIETGAIVIGSGITGDATLEVDGTVTIDGGTAGSLIVDLNNVTSTSTITANSVTGGTAVSTGDADIEVTEVDDAVINSTSAAWIIVGGGTDATDVVSISAKNAAAAGSTIGLETGQTQQVETITLSGNGGAATYVMNNADAPEAIILTGDHNVALSARSADVTGEPVTDTTSADASATLMINTLAATADLGSVAESVIVNLTATTVQVTSIDTPTTANYKFGAAQGGHVTLSSNASATASETLNLQVAVTQTVNTVVPDYETINITVDDDLAAVNTLTLADLQGNDTAGTVINISGADNLTLTAANSANINASAMTGKLSVIVATDLKTVTGGSGADTITLTDFDVTLDGGAGQDTLLVTASVDSSNNTASFSNLEIISMTGTNTTFTIDSSDATGKSWVINSDGADVIDFTADGTTIDLSNMTLDAANVSTVVDIAAINQGDTNIQGSNGVDTLSGAGTGNVTINGFAGADVIPTAGGADIIDGGAGDDNIDQGAGNDHVTGGEGADNINTSTGSDTIILTEVTAATDVLVVGGAGTDVITVTGFAVGAGTGADDITFSNTTVESYTNVTALVTGSGGDVAAGAVTLLKVTVAGTDIGAAANNIITLTGDYASTDALETAIETGGSLNLTFGALGTAGDSVLMVYDNGVDTKIATVKTSGAIVDGAKAAAGTLTVVDHVVLLGVADATTMLVGDFTAFAS